LAFGSWLLALGFLWLTKLLRQRRQLALGSWLSLADEAAKAAKAAGSWLSLADEAAKAAKAAGFWLLAIGFWLYSSDEAQKQRRWAWKYLKASSISRIK